MHGVGLQTSGPATNGTSTEADPVPIAIRLALKRAPEDLLDTTAKAALFEILGGPGHVPPDMALPPVITIVEPTFTQTGIGSPAGTALTVIVPLEQSGLTGTVCPTVFCVT